MNSPTNDALLHDKLYIIRTDITDGDKCSAGIIQQLFVL